MQASKNINIRSIERKKKTVKIKDENDVYYFKLLLT